MKLRVRVQRIQTIDVCIDVPDDHPLEARSLSILAADGQVQRQPHAWVWHVVEHLDADAALGVCHTKPWHVDR